jgi:molecular chaperone GrpE
MSTADEDLGTEPVPEVQYDEAAAAPEPTAAEPATAEEPRTDAGSPDADPAPTSAPTEQPDLDAVLAQRDEYLALARRVQADFENFRKRSIKQQQDHAAMATARLVESLLPVLDACDNAVIHGVEGVGAVHRQLLDVLAKAGLEVVPTDGVSFDPNQHEAVVHEPGGGGEPQIVEVLRTGYRWGGRVLRAAMVKVKD